MTHLDPAEFVDYVDGTLAADRAQHVEGCDRCRTQVALMRDAMRGVQIEGPNPSPLFWDRFPERVRDAIETDVPPVPAWRRPIAALGWTVAAVALSVIALRAPHPATVAPPVAPVADRSVPPAIEVSEPADEAWQVVSAAAADIQLDDAHAVGLGVLSPAVDKAVFDLSPDEREELGRLLHVELKRSGT